MACLLVGANCQAIIWTNAGILSIWPLGTNLSEMLQNSYIFNILFHIFSRKCMWKCCLQKCGHFVFGLNVLSQFYNSWSPGASIVIVKLTHWGLMIPCCITKLRSTFLQVMAWCLMAPSHHLKQLGQHSFRWWLGAWWHQAITWSNVDLSSVRSFVFHLRFILVEILQIIINYGFINFRQSLWFSDALWPLWWPLPQRS